MRTAKDRRRTAGLVLVVVGLSLLALQAWEGRLNEGALLVVIGGAFVAGYVTRKRYGLMVPGGILLGLGAGMLAEDLLWRVGNATVLGLGLGFLAIYLLPLAYERRSHWWPLIPGGILVVQALDETQRLFDLLIDRWPLILVLVGAVLVIASFRRSGEEPES